MAFLKHKKVAFEGGGLVLFNGVQDAMKAERVLKKADYAVKLVASPPELRKGCDLAVEINLAEQPGVEPEEAAIIAAMANRMAGKFARATPATKVSQVIAQFPAVFKEYLGQWSGVC